MAADSTDPTSTPWPETYWVIPGQLLAGEYPGAKYGADARKKLVPLLDAGIRFFLDLTEPHELEPYEALLGDLAAERGCSVGYRRIPIPDVSVPRDPLTMTAILDALDEAIGAGRPAYVHCWGGVGRTGTVIGCFHVRRGASGEEALGQVRESFRAMAKAAYRVSPETREQERYVLEWSESGSREKATS